MIGLEIGEDGKMKKRNVFWWGAAGLLLVASLCLLTGLLYRFLMNARAFNSRPLVLIHNPLNHEQVKVGERVLVHATARADNGLSRMELWVDDALVATQEPPESGLTSLVLSSDWLTTLKGDHILIVRAVSNDGVQGQATVTITALDSNQGGTGSHTVQDGETLETIAESHDTTPEALADLNPGIDPGGLAPGDELIVPDSEPPVEEGAAPSDGGEEAPAAEGEPPAGGGIFTRVFFGVFEIFSPEADRIPLRLEIPSLRTGEAYDGLHCYVELAGSPPQWYPDMDHDQATDESFTPLGDSWWDTAAHLEGDNAPVIAWPADQTLPLVVSCVGVVGGTEALELGRVEVNISPDEWDGVPRGIEVAGAEGSFSFSYRVTRMQDAPRGVPLFLDPDMSPPFNAHLDDRRISLRWDYEPRPDEESIDGFRVYLNGNLQWVEPPDARESGLPYEWFNPPCGSTYTFAVTAFRIGYPDGPESLPAIAILNQPLEDCTREIQITFLTLETFDLGGDGRYEDRHGDVGPAYGYFFANEQMITFDGGDLGHGLDMPNGLSHNTVYDLATMSADPTWRFSGMNSTIVDVPPGGTFEFGFHIMDEDSGRCHHSDDPGCHDPICDGLSVIYADRYSEFDTFHEGTLTSENGRCSVTFRWGPAFDSPVGSGMVGDEPLPWLSLTDFVVDEATGQVQLHVRNTGTATWPWRDLTVQLQTRAGEVIGTYTWPEFVLETGESTVLQHPDMILSAPFDACVLIDPNDDVLEAFERSGAMIHSPICPPQPDLTISDVRYDSSGSRLRVTVQNIASHSLENRTVVIQTFAPDGARLFIDTSWPAVSLEPWQTRTFDLIGVNEATRARLLDGYSVTVNPEGTIAESDLTNNTHTVTPARLKVWWCDSFVPHYHGLGSTARLFLTIDVLSGSSARTVYSLTRSNTLSSTETFSYGYNHIWDTGNSSMYFSCSESSEIFSIMGDEWLRVNISGDFLAGSVGSRDPLGDVTEIYGPASNWEAVDIGEDDSFPRSVYCQYYEVDPLFDLSYNPWWTILCIGHLVP
jgi:LysM repeat protein